jgi:4-amino-4-deoxy-L-arabinose transferase-like glycosyltransferase
MDSPKTDGSFLAELLGEETVKHPLLNRFLQWPHELRATLGAVLFASTIFIPYLGAVGLWDPWETHYGEVAREMIQRRDYVHPFWENAWFFSKPAFTMWMQALGMQGARAGTAGAFGLAVVLGALAALAWTRGKGRAVFEFGAVVLGYGAVLFAGLGIWGATVKLPYNFKDVPAGDGALPLFTEWGFRLPFTTFSILAVGLLAYMMARLVNARAALATAVVLCTMPLYFLLSRQAVTDPPIVAATICGISCACLGLFDLKSKHRAHWWYASYVFFGVATLAKGLLGFGIPMVVFILYVGLTQLEVGGVVDAAMWLVRRALIPLSIGVAVGLVVGAAAASYGAAKDTMFMAIQIDLAKPPPLGAPGWLGIMWGSLAFWAATTVAMRQVKFDPHHPPPKLIRLAFDMKLGTGILLFLAVCLPWYYEMFTFWRVDDESKLFWYRFIVHDHFARLGAGVHTTTPGGNFTYFIEQGGYAIYPWVVLLPGAFAAVSKLKLRGGAAVDGVGVVAVLWFSFTWFLIGGSATKFHHYVFPMLPPIAILMGLFIDRLWREGVEAHTVALLFGVPLLFLVGKDLSTTPKNFTDLFVYNYDRPYPVELTEKVEVFKGTNVKAFMGWCFAFFGVGAFLAVIQRNRTWLFTTALVGATTWAVWFSWSHWVDLSHHWTQRDQFWRYYSQRKGEEPIAAFLMNWRGETFYSRNQVKQIKDNPNVGMQNYASQPGRKWSLVEHARLGILKSAVGGRNVTLIDKDLNNKFVLVTID